MLDSIAQLVGGAIAPVMIIVVFVAFVLAVKYIVSRRKQIPPGKVGIFYGREYAWPDGSKRGYFVMTGGGRMLIPFFESYMEMPTTAFQIPIDEEAIPNKDNVKFNVKGVATCKVSTDPNGLNKAIDALIDKLTSGGQKTGTGRTPVEEFVLNILQGHLRSIVGKLDINQLLRNRDDFNKQVISESENELKELGIELKTLVIQDIKDDEGYIDALGKQAVADAKAEAAIKTAQATQREAVAVSNADKEAKTVKAQNEALIAQAERDRDLKQAEFLKETATVKAEAEMAGEIAKASAEQQLQVAQADRDAAATEARIKVAQKEAERKTADLQATVVATARAEAEKRVIDAEAAAKTRKIDADAEAAVLTATAQAKKDATVLEGEGKAAATRAELVAKAEGDAASARATLMAQAEGTRALNEAMAQMSDSAKLILVLDRLPILFDKGGDAGAKVLGSMFGPIAAGLGSIDSIRIVDMGGNGNGVGKMSGVVTDTVFQVLGQLKARGIDPKGLLEMAGVKVDGLDVLLDGIAPTAGANGQPAIPATTGETAHV